MRRKNNGETGITSDQGERLVAAIEKSGKYTLVDAADWPMLVATGGILLAVVAWLFIDMRNDMQNQRQDFVNAIKEFKESNQREHMEFLVALHNIEKNSVQKSPSTLTGDK